MEDLAGLFITCLLCFIVGLIVQFALISKHGYPIEKDCRVNINQAIYRVYSVENIDENKIVLNIYKLEN